MGLTMAEVMVLVLFALLLLIGFQAKKIGENAQARDQLVQVAQALGIAPAEISDNFERLVLASELAKELSQTKAGEQSRSDGLRDARELIAIGRDLRDGMGTNTVGQTPNKAAKDFVRAATSAFQRQGRQFGTSAMWVSDAVTAQQKDQGNGRVLPPCAVGPDGRPAYVFTARLFNHELELVDRDLESVRGLDAWPLFERIRRHETMNQADFLDQTRELFYWSKERNCRFFVWIDDATGVAEKRLYKERLRAVGQHFYYFEPNESVEGPRATQ